MKVLVVEREYELRKLLVYLLQRHGLEVKALPSDGPNALTSQSGRPYDAVVFNAEQTALRRRRWLFGHRPPKRGMRLVAFHDGAPSPPLGREEVDASLEFPFSSSQLLRAVVGDGAPREHGIPTAEIVHSPSRKRKRG